MQERGVLGSGGGGVVEEVGRVGENVAGLLTEVRGREVAMRKLAEGGEVVVVVAAVAAAVVVRVAIHGAIGTGRAECGPSLAIREVRGR